MKLFPHKKIEDIPTNLGGVVEVLNNHEFIDISSMFVLEMVRGIKKSYHTGLVAFMYEAQLKFGFDESYKISSVEFKAPFQFPDVDGLYLNGINLFLPTLKDVQEALQKNGTSVKKIDVGLEALSMGVSFFSNDYEDTLDVKLDGVTVHFNKNDMESLLELEGKQND